MLWINDKQQELSTDDLSVKAKSVCERETERGKHRRRESGGEKQIEREREKRSKHYKKSCNEHSHFWAYTQRKP